MLESLNTFSAPNKSPEQEKSQLEAFSKNLEFSKSQYKKVNFLEIKSKKYDEEEVCICEDFFNNKIDYDLCINQLNVKQQESEENNQKEVKSNLQEDNSKEKTLSYSKLADLSYIHLKTNPNETWNESFEFQTVSLDPTAFEHIDTIFESPNFATFTEDEIFLYNYINENKDNEVNYNLASNSEIESILEMAWLDRQLLASDIWAKWIYDWSKGIKRFLLLMWLHELVEKKEHEAKQNFENLKQDYEILDYFPNEAKWDNYNSWFWAVFLEKEWKKYIAIRWTEGLSDWKDLYADWKMALWKAPGEQIKAMTDFIDRCIIIPWEKFSIVWHSLWWALSQIATAMYIDQIKETYTFNSPWAKKLNVAKDDLQKFAKFNDFVHNRNDEYIWSLITNVEWAKWMSLITDLWEDIWSYTVELKHFSSHSITEMTKYIENLDENSAELIRTKIINKSEWL